MNEQEWMMLVLTFGIAMGCFGFVCGNSHANDIQRRDSNNKEKDASEAKESSRKAVFKVYDNAGGHSSWDAKLKDGQNPMGVHEYRRFYKWFFDENERELFMFKSRTSEILIKRKEIKTFGMEIKDEVDA